MEFYSFFFFSCSIEGNKVADEKKRSEPLRGLVWGKTSPGSSAVKRGKTRGLRPLLIWSDLVLITFTRPICLLRGAVSNGCVSGRCRSEFQALRRLFDRVNDWLGQLRLKLAWSFRGGVTPRTKVAFQVARRSFYSSHRSSYSNLTAVHVTSTQPVALFRVAQVTFGSNLFVFCPTGEFAAYNQAPESKMAAHSSQSFRLPH